METGERVKQAIVSGINTIFIGEANIILWLDCELLVWFCIAKFIFPKVA